MEKRMCCAPKPLNFLTINLHLKLKWCILFLIGLISVESFSQQTIIVIDKETEKVQNYAWVELLLNGYQPVTKGLEWKSNYLTNLREGIEIRPEDSLFFAVFNSVYMPVWEKIDVTSPDTLTIYLEPHPDFPEYNDSFINDDTFPFPGSFYPRVITSLEDIPEQDRETIWRKLRKYVGEELFKELKIIRAYSMHSDQMRASGISHRVPPNELVYHVVISFDYPSLGIENYFTSMQITSSGWFHKRPKLPDFDFLRVIDQSAIPVFSKNQILKKLSEGPRFDPKITQIKFEFSDRAGVFIWKSKESRIGPYGITFVTETHFDAFSGIVLAKFFDRLNIIYD
ncbi:hypothetical protein [Algoriphagus namhaensis]